MAKPKTEIGPCGYTEEQMDELGCPCIWTYLEHWGERLGCPHIDLAHLDNEWVATLRDPGRVVQFEAVGRRRGDALVMLDNVVREYVSEHYTYDDLARAR
jgi:hypothetical protein